MRRAVGRNATVPDLSYEGIRRCSLLIAAFLIVLIGALL